MDLPAAFAVAPYPLKSAWAFRVRRSPAGSEREIDAAITINVVRLDTNIIPGRRASNDVVLGPTWVFVPDNRIFGRYHDIELTIAVHIRGRDRITDLTGARVDLLRLKARKLRCDG